MAQSQHAEQKIVRLAVQTWRRSTLISLSKEFQVVFSLGPNLLELSVFLGIRYCCASGRTLDLGLAEKRINPFNRVRLKLAGY